MPVCFLNSAMTGCIGTRYGDQIIPLTSAAPAALAGAGTWGRRGGGDSEGSGDVAVFIPPSAPRALTKEFATDRRVNWRSLGPIAYLRPAVHSRPLRRECEPWRRTQGRDGASTALKKYRSAIGTTYFR